ncbi:MAG TPA: DUF362 domain-containing protein [Verrucomicrobiae bacterium]|nr:DUF362 domain-containing protein [Verrucomicrobiae bacterium]
MSTQRDWIRDLVEARDAAENIVDVDQMVIRISGMARTVGGLTFVSRISAFGFLVFLVALRARAQSPLLTTTNKPPPTARVVIVQDPSAMDKLIPVPDRIQNMVNRGITNLTGKASVIQAWRAIVSTQDVVGIKVFSSPGPNSGTRSAVVAAVVQDLIAAGIPARHITVWDKQSVDLRLAGYYEFEERFGIRVAGAIEAGYDDKTNYDTPLLGNMSWSDLEFGKKGPGVGRKSYVTKLLTKDITKIINISPMMHHNLAGVAGNLYTLAFGSVDNTVRFENDTAISRAIPEIYALPILGDRVALNIVDALICQYEGQDRGLLHYSTTLDELRFSRDPVALDVLSLQEIDRERQAAGITSTITNLDIYPNASLLEIGISDPKRIKVDRIGPE